MKLFLSLAIRDTVKILFPSYLNSFLLNPLVVMLTIYNIVQSVCPCLFICFGSPPHPGSMYICKTLPWVS